jgi:hypothetical protein
MHYPPGAHTWKPGPRIPAAWRLGSPVPAAVAVAPGSPAPVSKQASGLVMLAGLGLLCPPQLAAMAPGILLPNASKPQDLCCFVGTRQFKSAGLAASQIPSTCYSVPGTCHHTPKWTPGSGFTILLAPGGSRLPTEHGDPSTPHCPWQQESPHTPIKDWEGHIPNWGEESHNLLLCRLHQGPVPPGTQKPGASCCTSLQKSHISPVQELGFQFLYWMAICYSAGAWRPAPHSA